MGNTSVPIYYAFTFPFTYTECQNQLEHFNSMYGKTEQEIDAILDRLSHVEHKKDETISNQLIQEMDTLLHSLHPDRNDESNRKENKFAKMSPNEIYNDIYFHRELLIKSVEGRNVDLVTITSFHGIQSTTEERLTNLFPDLKTRRSNVFKDKKVKKKYFLISLLRFIEPKKNQFSDHFHIVTCASRRDTVQFRSEWIFQIDFG